MEDFTAIMIRAGEFGDAFGTKLILCVLALGLVAWDLYRHRRYDLLWAMVVGTAVLAGVELLAQHQDTRMLAEPSLFGVPIPEWIHLPLQGGSEGGAMAVFAVFFADRLSYDTLVEFAAVTMAFFALPAWVGLIKDHRPAATCDLPEGAAARRPGGMLTVEG